MATLPQLYDALKNADAAGATDDARKLADAIVALKEKAKAAGEAAASEKYDPTSGMSALELGLAGAGKAVEDVFMGGKQGLAQIADFVSPRYRTTADLITGRNPSRYSALQAEEADRRALDAPLMRTGAGMTGNVLGNIAMAYPTLAIPGAASIPGSALIGSAFGLTQPTIEGESRFGNALIGGAFGAAIPAGLAGLSIGWRRGKQAFQSLFNPDIVAENALASAAGTGDEVVNALIATQGAETTPGFRPTLSERVVSQGVQNPTIAALESRLAGGSSPVNRQVYVASQQRLTALQEQLQRIEERLVTQRQMMTPQARQSLDEARQGILANIEREQQTLAQMNQQVAGQLPSRTTEPGQELIGRRGELKTETQKNVTGPAWKKTVAAAGDTPISTVDLTSRIEQIFGRPFRDIPRSVSSTVDKLRAWEGKPATLEQLQDLRAAINADAQAARVQGANPALRDMNQMKDAIDDAINNSNLSDEAKSLYSQWRSTYRTEIGERFNTGLAKQLGKMTNLGETRITPENVVKQFLSGERGPAAFTSLFRGDPQAATSMSNGIQALFRQSLEGVPAERVGAVAEAFLRKNAAALSQLEQAGVRVRSALETVRAEAVKNSRGLTELKSLASKFGDDNEDSLIRSMLSSPQKMADAIKYATADGRSAISQKVTEYVYSLMDKDPETALKFLSQNRLSVDRAMRGSGTNWFDLKNSAELFRDFRAVKLPDKPVGQSIVDLSAGYTDDQLHSLELVARDIKNMEDASSQAAFGRGTPKPQPGKAATEEGERTLGPQHVPGWFSAKISALKAIWAGQQTVIDNKTLAKLFRYMYEDPDAAIEALRRGQARAAAVRKNNPRILKAGAAGAVGLNALSKSSSNNALAEQ